MSSANNSSLIASVIVLNYNGERYIQECLTSLLQQDMATSNYEIICFDNASTDNSTALVAEHFPTVRLISSSHNHGFCVGNNLAADHANGRYLAFLNMDTTVHPQWLSSLCRAMDSAADIKACQSNMVMPWALEYSEQLPYALPERVYYYDLCRYGFAAYRDRPRESEPFSSLFLEGGAFIIDAELTRGPDYPFDADFGSYCEDLDLALRINIHGYRTVTVPDAVVFHHHSFARQATLNSRTATTAIRAIRNRIAAFYKNMTLLEFVLFLPVLILGAPMKVRELGWPTSRQVIYGVATVPVALISLLQALWMLSSWRVKRQQNLRHRTRQRMWLLNALTRAN